MPGGADLSGYHAASSFQPPPSFSLNSEWKSEQPHLQLQLQTCFPPPISFMPMVPYTQTHYPFYEVVPNGQFSFYHGAGLYLSIP